MTPSERTGQHRCEDGLRGRREGELLTMLLLTAYYSLLTTDYLLLTTYYLRVTIEYLRFITCYVLLATYYLPRTTYCVPTTHYTGGQARILPQPAERSIAILALDC